MWRGFNIRPPSSSRTPQRLENMRFVPFPDANRSAASPVLPLGPSQLQRYRTLERRFAGGRPKTVLLGDSRGALWPKDLWKQVGRGAANLAISLTRVQDHIWQVRNTAIDLSGVQAFVVISGYNDLNRTDAAPGEIAQSVAALMSLLKTKAPGASCLALEVFPARPAPSLAYVGCYSEARRLELNRRLRELAGLCGFTCVDTRLSDPSDTTLYEDGVHLTRLAYERYLAPAAVAALDG